MNLMRFHCATMPYRTVKLINSMTFLFKLSKSSRIYLPLFSQRLCCPFRCPSMRRCPYSGPPDPFEPEWLVPADPKFEGGASYVIINQINGKRYEGETVNFHERHKAHRNLPFNLNESSYNCHLYSSIRKYGFDKFKFYFRHKFVFEGRERLSKEERKAFHEAFKAAYLHPCENVLDSAS